MGGHLQHKVNCLSKVLMLDHLSCCQTYFHYYSLYCFEKDIASDYHLFWESYASEVDLIPLRLLEHTKV